MQLRYYQRDAVRDIYRFLEQGRGNPCCVIPTGGGKTAVITTICRDLAAKGLQVASLASSRELVDQCASSIRAADPSLPVGIYSAGLGRRDTGHAMTIATIGSVYSDPSVIGSPAAIIVDEAHQISARQDSMYARVIQHFPGVPVIGFTATPYRTREGSLTGPGSIFDGIAYSIGVKELIDKGFLSRLATKPVKQSFDLRDLEQQRGEFTIASNSKVFGRSENLRDAVKETLRLCAARKSVLVFAASVENAEKIAGMIRDAGEESECVTGETVIHYRDEILGRFRAGNLKYLVNVGVLTTGFDAPNVDAVVLLRATASPGLYYQMVGRGFRIYPGKTDCLVLDYGDNIYRHGPVDRIQPQSQSQTGERRLAKDCPGCETIIAIASTVCEHCGYVFQREPRPPAKVSAEAATANIISDGEPEWVDVLWVEYAVHTKRGDPTAPKTMRVTYFVDYHRGVSEWVCFEHDGFAGDKAARWWRDRCVSRQPESVEEAVMIANAGGLAEPTRIIHSKDQSGFDRITAYDLGPKPERDAWSAIETEPPPEEEKIHIDTPRPLEWWEDDLGIDSDEIPF